jgi:threonine synthase
VHALVVDGDFDDCQAAVKDMFNDFAFRRGQTGWREFDQLAAFWRAVVHFTAVSLGAPYREVSFTVPTGNFRRHRLHRQTDGLPIADLVVATNRTTSCTARCKPGPIPNRGVSLDDQPVDGYPSQFNFERALLTCFKWPTATVAAQGPQKGRFPDRQVLIRC